MSTDRSSNTGRSLKPTIPSTKTLRMPLTPRVAGTSTPSTRSTISKTSTTRSEPPRVTPRVKQEDTFARDTLSVGNVTPRSSARKSRAGSATPTQDDDTPSALPRPKSVMSTSSAAAERGVTVGGLGSGGGLQRARVNKPKSLVNDSGSSRALSPPLLRSPAHLDLGRPARGGSKDGHFFHASDVVRKQEPVQKKPEPKKLKHAAFFYADGQQEEGKAPSTRTTSPVLSAVSEKRSSGPWIRTDNPAHSPPMLSPALSTLSSTSPFFAAPITHHKPRSPSPSKENIHLSYRKGASQIFGTRPAPRPGIEAIAESRRGSLELFKATPHKKSPSLSSIDSGNSQQSRRRSATTIDVAPSPLTQEVKSATMPRASKPISSINTSLGPPDLRPAPESALSPTRSVSELAADARRERKVLDLEISNSSLLAINASLEREVRRQKAELKRFRRLSRAGRLSVNPHERSARFSESLSVLGEEDAEDIEDANYSAFGPPSGFTDVYDDWSDDESESESVTSCGESLSPSAQASRDSDRLAKDEKRLQVDLERHKELLVQSQMMNQSLKRCTYASEQMIKDGKKALDYRVKVSDVRLGGRILTGQEGEEDSTELEIEDETLHGDDGAEDFLKVWQSIGRNPAFEGSESGGDRDSGIEVDQPPAHTTAGFQQTHHSSDSGRPPDA